MDPIPVAALAYAGPDALPSLRPPWRTAALRLVQACWALPLAAGLFIFIAAWASGRDRSELWAVAGLWDIAVGTALAAVGGIAIQTFVAGRWQAAAGDRWRQVFRPALSAGLMLASNFVAAYGLIVAAATLRLV
jgi:hypothetical protein